MFTDCNLSCCDLTSVHCKEMVNLCSSSCYFLWFQDWIYDIRNTRAQLQINIKYYLHLNLSFYFSHQSNEYCSSLNTSLVAFSVKSIRFVANDIREMVKRCTCIRDRTVPREPMIPTLHSRETLVEDHYGFLYPGRGKWQRVLSGVWLLQ